MRQSTRKSAAVQRWAVSVLGALRRAGDALLGEEEMTCGARSVRAEMPLQVALVRGPTVAVVGAARMNSTRLTRPYVPFDPSTQTIGS